MPTIPTWLTTGVGPFTVVLTPQTNTAGTLADTTPVRTMTADIRDVRFENIVTHENLKAMTRLNANMVIVDEVVRVTIVEILKYTGTNATAYWKCVITRGAQAITLYLVRGTYSETYTPNGCPAEAEFYLVDTGSGVWSYA
jgi:hypothetical protein